MYPITSFPGGWYPAQGIPQVGYPTTSRPSRVPCSPVRDWTCYRRSVCLLRSYRRTFLFVVDVMSFNQEHKQHLPTNTCTGPRLQRVRLHWVPLTTSSVTLGPVYNEFGCTGSRLQWVRLHWSCLQWVRLHWVLLTMSSVALGSAYNEFGCTGYCLQWVRLHWVLLTMSSFTLGPAYNQFGYTGSHLQHIQLQRAPVYNQ